jgi:predicted porin
VTPASKLLGQVYVARDLKVNGSSADDTGAKLFEVGVEHSLSKRTMLKATYAMINNDKGAAYDFGINAPLASTPAPCRVAPMLLVAPFRVCPWACVTPSNPDFV